MLKISFSFNRQSIFKVIVFCSFVVYSVCYRYFYFHEYDDISLSLLNRIDIVGAGNSFIYLDDSVKYEKTLLQGLPLLTYHGSLGLEYLRVALFPLSEYLGVDIYWLFFVVNLLLVLLVFFFLLFHVHPFWVVPTIPYLSTLVFTVNKEIITIVFLLVSSFACNHRLFCYYFNSYRYKHSFYFYSIGAFVFVFAVVPTILSRPSLFGIVIAYFFISKFFLKIKSHYFLAKLSISSIIRFLAFVCVFIIVFISLGATSFSSALANYSTAWIANYEFNSIAIIGLLYSLIAPFPFSFVSLGRSLFAGSPVFLLVSFGYFCLAFASIVRFYLIWTPLLSLRFTRLLSGQGLFIMVSALIGIKGFEITRQLVTVLIPSYYFLSLQLCSKKN